MLKGEETVARAALLPHLKVDLLAQENGFVCSLEAKCAISSCRSCRRRQINFKQGQILSASRAITGSFIESSAQSGSPAKKGGTNASKGE
jgi:hypothetical protein